MYSIGFYRKERGFMKVIILKKLSYITAIILTVFLVTVMMTVTVLSEE